MNRDCSTGQKSKLILADQDLKEWYETSWFPSWGWRFRLIIVKISHFFMTQFFRILGLSGRGYKNALDLQIEYKELNFSDLPKNFHGTKILFLSDFHLGGMKELPEIIVSKIQHLEIDLCLLGGDYRFSVTQPTRPFLKDMEKIISCIRSSMGIFGVLGNHDGLEIVPAMERLGMKILLNESIRLQKGEESINLIGGDVFVDFRRNDLEKAFNGINQNEFNLFLTHSPCIFEEAQEQGASLYLCGHTHHGQVRIPKIGALFTATRAPKMFAQGDWRYKDMVGFTGPGLGTVAATVRFRCPPKAVVLTLKNKNLLNPS